MSHKFVFGLCVATAAFAVACGQSSAPLSPSAATGSTAAAADGSTLKIGAPTILSPSGGFQFQPNTSIVLTLQNVSGTFVTFPVTYEIEIRNGANSVVLTTKVAAGAGSTTVTTVSPSSLQADTLYTWRTRATYGTGVGPWSATASFKTPLQAFISGNNVFDPLTNGFTVGVVHGAGRFILGQGWQSGAFDSGIDYDIATCASCQVEFDVTGVGNGLGNPADMKWISMADAGSFGDFDAFRNNEWKMTLEQRGDGDGTGMKLIWRNGDAGDGEPGDHTGKLESTINWKDFNVYHFLLRWSPAGFTVQVDGQEFFSDGFGGNQYRPPHHRVSLGCYPRGETLKGVTWRNVQIKPV